ncbi:hypothetical protein ACLB2K_063148 [Fragaria x ananassa]
MPINSGTTSSPIYEPHSFLYVFDVDVIAQARDLDEKLRRNEEVGPLVGVLVAVKDNICTAEMSSTTGSGVLKGYTPLYDTTAVRKIKELGGIVVGKTNLDEFGMGSTTKGFAFQSKAYKVLLKAQEAAISKLKSGNKLSVAYQAAVSVVEKDALELAGNLTKTAGTGIGLEYRESGLKLNAKNDRIFKQGMVFNVSLGF